MTIGDEKVVAWLLDSGGNRTYWADEETARKEYENLCVLGYRSDTTLTTLIPHSAYAELAADRDLWRSMATFEGKVSASVLDDLHTTQAQLAELRGRVSLYGQERAHLQDVNAHLIKVLSAIHMRCAPKDIEMADGTKRRFVPPDPEFYWRELSGKVAAIKAEIQFTPRTLAAADGGGG